LEKEVDFSSGLKLNRCAFNSYHKRQMARIIKTSNHSSIV